VVPAGSRPRTRIAQRLSRSVGSLSTAALARMERDMPWFADLPAQDRSWVGLIVQAGIKAFVDWFREPTHRSRLRAEVFGAAPQTMAGVISLQQTVELIRLSIEVVEENIADVVGEADAAEVRHAIDSYAREVAFATAEVYARQAEQRGAWDARLEALVVDSVLRAESGEGIASRASALGWDGRGQVVVVVGGLEDSTAIEDIRRTAHEHHLDCLCAVQGDRLVVVLGGVDEAGRAAAAIADSFAKGPVVIGPVVAGLTEAHQSARSALSGLAAAAGWPDAPRPVRADDLLPERALLGDADATEQLRRDIHGALKAAGESVLGTVRSYLELGSSVEGTARALFVHPNTVRYRLKRAEEATGLSAADPRDAWTLRMALTLGQLGDGDL
jgi:sugar diacid utilization regulator